MKWEYSVLFFSEYDDRWKLNYRKKEKLEGLSGEYEAFNALGDEGWELVSVFKEPGSNQKFYFKRPRPA